MSIIEEKRYRVKCDECGKLSGRTYASPELAKGLSWWSIADLANVCPDCLVRHRKGGVS